MSFEAIESHNKQGQILDKPTLLDYYLIK